MSILSNLQTTLILAYGSKNSKRISSVQDRANPFNLVTVIYLILKCAIWPFKFSTISFT